MLLRRRASFRKIKSVQKLEYYYLNMQIEIPISIGELIDKITILEIKYENISDSEKNKLINVELNLLNSIYKKIGPNKELEQLKQN